MFDFVTLRTITLEDSLEYSDTKFFRGVEDPFEDISKGSSWNGGPLDLLLEFSPGILSCFFSSLAQVFKIEKDP